MNAEYKKKASLTMFKHLNQLVGKTIEEIVRDGGSQCTDECFGLLFTDGTTAWVQCDPEGNGPGFLEIEKPSKP